MDMSRLLPVFVIISIVAVILLTELIKRLDKKDRLKGWRVWIPAILSGIMSALTAVGKFFPDWRQMFFWWAVIFALSVFCYEAILRHIHVWLDLK